MTENPENIQLFHQWLGPNSQAWAKFYRTDDLGYLVSFPDFADFTISRDGKTILPVPHWGTSTQTLEHLHRNQILPLALSRQLKLVLHGAAIDLGQQAIAVLGLSGRGKSTLTASFATAGYRFLTDDGLQLDWHGDDVLAKPSHPSIRLWQDSESALVPAATAKAPPVDYTPKARLLAGDAIPHCPEPRPLGAIYFLGDGSAEDIRIAPVSRRDAMVELVRHSFLLDIEEREMLSHHFGQLSDLVRRVPCFSLDYPRDYGLLGEVRKQIIGHNRQW